MFTTILYEPLFNALFYIYNFVGDIGIAIILLTLLIKAALFAPSFSSIKSQKALQEIQPKIDEIRKKYKGDQQKMGEELMKVYKENKVNPFSSCLPLLIQLPILWALYRVFFGGLTTDPNTGLLVAEQLQHLYPALQDIFISKVISTHFLGVDLAQSGNYVFAIIAGGLQFLQTRMLSARKPAIQTQGAKDENAAAMINKQMLYFLPLITIFFGVRFPAGLALYWVVSTLFQVVQQWYMFSYRKKKEEAKETKA